MKAIPVTFFKKRVLYWQFADQAGNLLNRLKIPFFRSWLWKTNQKLWKTWGKPEKGCGKSVESVGKTWVKNKNCKNVENPGTQQCFLTIKMIEGRSSSSKP
ncbi:MAG: hypothetical protein ACP5RH_02955 [Leptodesmis sp.]|uniref:hypothetical protein n=1 Tax=Leptodesmis sp. TaxID=3100501 RepID=UPI003D0F29DA